MATWMDTLGGMGDQVFHISSLISTFIYSFFVILGYATEGPEYGVGFVVDDPVRSLGRLIVGLGVKGLAFIVRMGTPIANDLFEASADVGLWFIGHCSTENQSRFLSPFIYR